MKPALATGSRRRNGIDVSSVNVNASPEAVVGSAPDDEQPPPTLLSEQSLRSEETRNGQVLALPRFHVKHGKGLSRYRGDCAARPYRGVAVLRRGSQASLEGAYDKEQSHDASRAALYR